MIPRPCPREEAVLAAALDAGSRPADADLLAHLDGCQGCRDLYRIASALHDDHAEHLAHARVPSAGQVWWRAELRARQEAAAVATRPITVATGIAAACLVGLLVSVAGALTWWLVGSLAAPATHVLGTVSTASTWEALLGARAIVWFVAGLLLATPLVLYVAWREE